MIHAHDIRDVLNQVEALSGRVEAIGDDDDLYDGGLDSFGSVQLMLALEERFGIEFPDHLLTRRSFSTIRMVRDTVAALSAAEAA